MNKLCLNLLFDNCKAVKIIYIYLFDSNRFD